MADAEFNFQFFVLLLLLFPKHPFTLFFFFFKYNFTFIDKTYITVAKFKTKRKYISILQNGSKLHKDEKEKYSSCNNTHNNDRPAN